MEYELSDWAQEMADVVGEVVKVDELAMGSEDGQCVEVGDAKRIIQQFKNAGYRVSPAPENSNYVAVESLYNIDQGVVVDMTEDTQSIINFYDENYGR